MTKFPLRWVNRDLRSVSGGTPQTARSQTHALKIKDLSWLPKTDTYPNSRLENFGERFSLGC
jgi:hypothetical protein